MSLFVFIQGAHFISTSILQVHKKHVRNSTEEPKDIKTIHFTQTQWEALTHFEKDELEIEGKRFDICSKTYSYQQIIVKGFFDIEEDSILKITNLLKKKNATNMLEKKVSFLNQLFCETQTVFNFNQYKFVAKTFFRNQFLNYSIHLSNEAPPPRWSIVKML